MPLTITEIQNRVDRIVDSLRLKIDSHETILKNCIDSIEFVELYMALEKEFNVTITNEEADNCETLNDFAKLIGHIKEII